jgi:hypothetical protein
MKHYYDDHPFTPIQAKHAEQIVLDLISKRRFFLHHEHPNSYHKNDYSLPPEVFARAMALDSSLRSVYKEMQAKTIKNIMEAETSLGITHAKLPADTVIVECKKYSGGFEVCRVYPLSSFLFFTPTLKQLLSEMYERELYGKSEDDYSKNELAKKKEASDILAEKIFADIEKLQDSDPNNKKCLVLLNSLVGCGGNDNGDFAKNKVKDMQGTNCTLL